jgi:hypothetical protein
MSPQPCLATALARWFRNERWFFWAGETQRRVATMEHEVVRLRCRERSQETLDAAVRWAAGLCRANGCSP